MRTRQAIAAALIMGSMAVAAPAVAADNATSTTTSSATLYGPMAAPRGVGNPAWHTASQWDSPEGDRPTTYGDWWRLTAHADPTPALKRRVEIKPGASQAAAEVRWGQVSTYSAWVLPRLGAAAYDGRSWHSVVQLIGPNVDGQWVGGASVALVVRDGRWSLEQGLRKWHVDMGPYVDGQPVYVRIAVRAGESGSVTATVGSTTRTVEVPTWWHRYQIWSTGLYRGSGNTPFSSGGIQPTYEQSVYLKDVRVTSLWPAA